MKIGFWLVLILATLFMIPMGLFVFSTFESVSRAEKLQREILHVTPQRLAETIRGGTPSDTLKNAVAAAGYYIGWDDHWPTWGFGINAPGDPGHLLWEFKAVPKKLCDDSPRLDAECAKYFHITENILRGRIAAANADEWPAVRAALRAFAVETGVVVQGID